MLVEIDTILKPTLETSTSTFDQILFTFVCISAFIPVLLVLRPLYSYVFPRRQVIIRRPPPPPPIVVAVEEIVFPRHINVFYGPHRIISSQ